VEYEKAGLSGTPRTREQIKTLFAGLDLLEPGLVPVSAWRPDTVASPLVEIPHLGGVARKNAIWPAAGSDRTAAIGGR
jgi:hypothetical protein